MTTGRRSSGRLQGQASAALALDLLAPAVRLAFHGLLAAGLDGAPVLARGAPARPARNLDRVVGVRDRPKFLRNLRKIMLELG